MANYNEMILFARELRKNPTNAENILWKYLRNKQLKGFKFLRQHPLIISEYNGDFSFLVPDFYCGKARLAIELDGKIHDYRKKLDNEKEKDLNDIGIKVLRFRNEELQEINKVLKIIELQLIN